jgi:TP901 family phage tail tape measure protein
MPSKSFNVATKFTATDGVTRKLKNMGQAAAGVARQSGIVTAAAGAAIISIFNVNKTFQQSMNRIEARLGDATGDQLKQLEGLAKKLGKTTAFSASQAADAMGFLAMAGWNANQILAATPDLLNLAAAAEMDLARAADITSNVMGAFEMEAKRAGEATDVLAALTSMANVDMEMLADTFKMAAPIAHGFGASLRDAGVAAGFLGNIGIQGTTAGTAIKGLFSVLSNPPAAAQKWFSELNLQTTEIDKNGKRVMRSFSDTMGELGVKLGNLSQPERLKAIGDIFGKIVGPAAIALSKDLEKPNGEFSKLSKRMETVDGRTKKMADTMQKGAPGAINQLVAAIEGLNLAIGESGLLSAVVGVITKTTEFIAMLTGSAPILTWILGAILGISGAITIVAGSILMVSKMWAMWTTAVTVAGVAMKGFTAISTIMSVAIKGLNLVMAMNPIGLIVFAVSALIVGFATLVAKTGGVKNAFMAIGDAIMGIVRAVGQFFGLIDEDKNVNVNTTATTVAGATTAAGNMAASTNGRVDVNVYNKSPDRQDVQATGTGTGLKMKLNPAAS